MRNKNSLNGLNSTVERTEDKISKLEDRSIEFIQIFSNTHLTKDLYLELKKKNSQNATVNKQSYQNIGKRHKQAFCQRGYLVGKLNT